MRTTFLSALGGSRSLASRSTHSVSPKGISSAGSNAAGYGKVKKKPVSSAEKRQCNGRRHGMVLWRGGKTRDNRSGAGFVVRLDAPTGQLGQDLLHEGVQLGCHRGR
jgi:hypothetical protein